MEALKGRKKEQRKQEVQLSDNMNNDDVSDWTDGECRYFIKLYTDEKRKGNKTKTGLNITAKECIIAKFEDRFGKRYVWEKFKNKYDVCRRTYNKVKKLIHNRTGLGYDELGRLNMSDDWWNERIKEWPDARRYKNKLVPNMDVFEEEFGAVCVTGAEGWSAQQGETSLDSRMPAENDEEVESFAHDSIPPPVIGTQSRGGSSGSKRKHKDIDMVNETCAARTTVYARKNELVEEMIEYERSFSVTRVVDILNGLPGVRLWSPFYRASLDHLISDAANRQGFIAFTTPENQILYLEHRTGIKLDD